MKNIDIILRPVVTEKSARLQSQKTYAFLVSIHANKHQIAHAIAQIYKAKVMAVRTVSRTGKTVRVGRSRTKKVTQPSKVAYVTVDKELSVITHG
jgi:large subunit ribosomal protein L23